MSLQTVNSSSADVGVCVMCTVDLLYQYSCEWNYRPDHCMYMSNCHAAELRGVSVLHGCRRAFHIDKWPVFRAIYQAVVNVS